MVYISTVIAFFALFISILAYRLSSKLPNENKIFEEKIRGYNEIIKVMNDSLNEIFACISEYSHTKKGIAQDKKVLREDLYGNIDEVIYAIEDVITNNSLVLTNEVYEKLDAFCDFLDQDYLEKYDTDEKAAEFEEKAEDEFNALIDAMRVDLDVDKLNTGLRKRIAGIKSSRRLILNKDKS